MKNRFDFTRTLVLKATSGNDDCFFTGHNDYRCLALEELYKNLPTDVLEGDIQTSKSVIESRGTNNLFLVLHFARVSTCLKLVLTKVGWLVFLFFCLFFGTVIKNLKRDSIPGPTYTR